jgi:ABC-type antimicrobial peptide transport system permease subunit
MAWLSEPKRLEMFAALLMMTLPGDRDSYYQDSDVAVIRGNVYAYTDEISEALGFFPLTANNAVLDEMTLFNFALLFIGLIFDIVIILFVMISVLLIYSLLMITTETKTFDIGIMRLIGLSSSGFVAMVFIQAVMFVLPSIIFAYICAYPALWGIFKKMFGNNLSKGEISIVPSGLATLEAFAVGLLIPTLSAIIPI